MIRSDESEKQPLAHSVSGQFRFTIRSMMIFTAVVAAGAFCLNYYVRALGAKDGGIEIGMFAMVTAMVPSLFLVSVSWLIKIFGRYLE
jgi:hypothetical protein